MADTDPITGRDFDNWMLENYSYLPDGTPIEHVIPIFARSDGLFDVEAHQSWVEERLKEFLVQRHRRR